jgi:hypothetical protein
MSKLPINRCLHYIPIDHGPYGGGIPRPKHKKKHYPQGPTGRFAKCEFCGTNIDRYGLAYMNRFTNDYTQWSAAPDNCSKGER